MKIALVCPASSPATQFGGIMFLCLNWAKGLSSKGHKITVFTTDLDFANNVKTFNKKLSRKEKFEGFLINRTHVVLSIKLFFINPLMYFEMNKEDIDLIHCIGIRSFQALIAAIISQKRKIPLIISDQGGLTTHPDINNGKILTKILYKIQNPIIKYIINQSTKIIVPNQYEKEIFQNFTKSDKIEIIRNGINLDEFENVMENFTEKYSIKNEFILFVGRFHFVKGVDILIESVNEIKNYLILKNIKCVIMGVDFGYEETMLNLINKYNLNNIIKVIRKPSREDIISAYISSKFLVLPSRWELSPLTPIEGFASKKTVISSNCHGIPHTFEHEKHGILIEKENFKEMAEKIIFLIENPMELEKLSKNAYQFVLKECNSKFMINRIEQIYLTLNNSDFKK